MFPSRVTASLAVCLWGALLCADWEAGLLAFPVFAAVFLFAALTPRVDAKALAEMKGAGAAPPRPPRTEVDLGGEWEYGFGAGAGRFRARVPGDLGGVFGVSWRRRTHHYRREVELPEGRGGKRAFLVFGGAGGEFEARVDGERVGRFAAFLPAEVEVTEYIKKKKKINLYVRVRDAHGATSPLSPGRVGFAFAKGLYGHVRLEFRAPVFVASAALAGDSGAVVRVRLDGALTHPAALAVEVVGGDGAQIFNVAELIPPFQGGREVELRLPSPPPEWTPDSPAAHRLRVRIASGPAQDEIEIPFARNRAEWREDGVFYGGSARKPVGVSWLDFLPPYGASIPAWGVQRDARTLKEAGFNLVWVEHLPPSEALLDACDREGLFVAGELTDVDEERLRAAAAHPCVLFLAAKGGAAPAEIVRRVVMPDAGEPEIPAVAGRTGKPALLVVEHFDGSLGGDSRRFRDHRRAAFDMALLERLAGLPVAGVALGSMIYWGYRIGLLAETRRPTFAHQAAAGFLKRGVLLPVNIEKPLPAAAFALPALAAALAALALPAMKPFVDRFWWYPDGAYAFTGLWEALAVRAAAAAVVALAFCNRLQARPMRAPELFARLPLFFSRPLTRKRHAQFAAALAAWLWLSYAGMYAAAAAAGTNVAGVAGVTAFAGAADLALLALLMSGAYAPVVFAGGGAIAFALLLNFLSPAAAAAYAAVAFGGAAALTRRG